MWDWIAMKEEGNAARSRVENGLAWKGTSLSSRSMDRDTVQRRNQGRFHAGHREWLLGSAQLRAISSDWIVQRGRNGPKVFQISRSGINQV